MADKHIHTRTRVSGDGTSRGQRRVFGVVILLALGLIGTMIWAGRTPAPPPVAQITPSPIPDQTSDRLYYLQNNYFYIDGTGSQLVLADAATLQQQTVITDVRDFIVSPDGARLYLIWPASISALDVASGTELWRTPIRDVAGTDFINPSPLALSPDGRTLYVYSQQFQLPYASVARTWMQVLDTATGTPDRTIVLPRLPGSSRFIGATATRLLIHTPDAVLCADLQTPNQYTTTIMGRLNGKAVLVPDGSALYVVDTNGSYTTIDPQTCSVREQHDLDVVDPALVFVPGLAEATPDGQLVLGFNNTGSSSDPNASPDTSGVLMLVDSATGTVQRRWRSDSDFNTYPGLLTVSSRDGSIYVLNGDSRTLMHFTFNAEQPIILPLSLSANIPRFEVVADRGTGVFDAPATPIPLPTPVPPLVGSDDAPLGWLTTVAPPAPGSLLSVDNSGATTLLVQSTSALIPRSGQPPLAVVKVPPATIAIYDPAANITTTLPITTYVAPTQAVLSPDGSAVALMMYAALPNEDSRTARKLVVRVQLDTGETQVIVDELMTPLLNLHHPVGWSDGWIYFTTNDLVTNVDAYRIWRVRDDGWQTEPEVLATVRRNYQDVIGGQGPWPKFDAEAGVMLYIIRVDESVADLHLYDLRTGADQVIVANQSGWNLNAAVSPDGALVAYLASAPDTNAQELTIYNRQSGTTTVWGDGLQSYSSLVWTPDSAYLVIQSIQTSLQRGISVQMLVFRRDNGALVNTLPVPGRGITQFDIGSDNQLLLLASDYAPEQRNVLLFYSSSLLTVQPLTEIRVQPNLQPMTLVYAK